MQTKRPLLQPVVAAACALLAQATAHADYQTTVLGDGPKAYYRLNDDTTRPLGFKNSGSLGAPGNGTNDLAAVTGGVVHSIPGAIVGDANPAAFYDFTTRTEIPFNALLNTPNNQPFSVEAWLLPANDQDTTAAGGMGVMANRWTQGGNRQGWVVYQRRPNAAYSPPAEGLGWEFRMYDDLSTSTRLDVISQKPFKLGQWQHVVVVYDPVLVSNATLTIYIDGVQANQTVWNGGAGGTLPGYGPCTGAHDPAPNGQPAMALGNYNNANSGTAGASNPWFGGIDEFAWYPAKLTAAQVLAHYQNGTNANRTQAYSALIQSHNPRVYLRLDEPATGPDYAVNLGSVGRNAGGGFGGTNGLGTNTAEVRHPAFGAIRSDKNSRATAYHTRNGRATTTLPFSSENNGDVINPSTGMGTTGTGSAGVPFTFEAWLRPMRDAQGGQSPVCNRMVGGTGRTGWVLYQRNPNLTYPASEGHGWDFRLYTGSGNGGQDVLTGYDVPVGDPMYHVGDYTVGQWQHLVVTWEPQSQYGDVGGNGNDQWLGVLTAYVDGLPTATNQYAFYAANRLVPETSVAPADLAVGSYNIASGIGNNPYEGDVAELAIYNNYILTPDQILAHYQAGTNAGFGTNYAAMVFGAAAEALPAISERTTLPATFLRLSDAACYPATNAGSLGTVANGDLVLTTNNAVGPRPPTYAGFEAANTALPLDGVKQWASFNNPAGLNLSGRITLEAWVKPAATQGAPARILSHGPPTKSDFLAAPVVPDFAVTNTTEVFLRLENAGASYVVGSTAVVYTNNVEIGSNTYSASFAVPAGDLGGTNWIHLAGTYDGTTWRLYRNGLQVASAVAPIGPLPVLDGDWAVGATGNGWADNFGGTVDEVAIYDQALGAKQIATHYVMGRAGTTALTIARSGSSVTIAWPAGTTLQQSATASGGYADVPGSPTSPLTVTPSGVKFYRWRL